MKITKKNTKFPSSTLKKNINFKDSVSIPPLLATSSFYKKLCVFKLLKPL